MTSRTSGATSSSVRRWSLFTALILLLSNSAYAQEPDQCTENIVVGGCDPNDEEYCKQHCELFGTTYLRDKCCKHVAINTNLLAFEEADLWKPRLANFHKCTGANIHIAYVEGGEDAMEDALKFDVGVNGDPTSGQGIYDAYIVQAPWLTSVFEGLESLSERIKLNDNVIRFNDINQASRSAVSFDGQVRALPLDADYIAMGYRQDVFNKHASRYLEEFGEELTVPRTIEEMVIISERLNGWDHNGDGEGDWGFCLTPQTNYFQAFVAPHLQTQLKDDKDADTGQNIFFDVDTFEPLIYNDGFRKAVELYWRFVKSSNCQYQTPNGQKCSRKTAFPTGRCAGVISMPGTLTNLLREGGKYAPPPENRMDEFLEEGQYWGRREVFPGSSMVIDWNSPETPLVACNDETCPRARNNVNYAPFFSEGGESFGLNGKQSKPSATDAMWDLFAWFSELPVGEIPLAGTYRRSQLTESALDALIEQWNNTILAEDLHAVLNEYFKEEGDGGNPVQDLFIVGFTDYNKALNTELHDNLVLADMADGGLFNMADPANSVSVGSDLFEERYARFVKDLAKRYDDVNANMDGGALQQLFLWRGALNLKPTINKDEICANLLALRDFTSFDKLECNKQIVLRDLCQSQKEDVEAYMPGECATGDNNATIIIAVLCSIVGAGLLVLFVYTTYKRYQSYVRIRNAHEQLMEATLNESIMALRSLDYPLHLIYGSQFLKEGRLVRHEILRNSHKLTVLDSLEDVDAFVAAGKQIVFFSHQWTAFSLPDPSNRQYDAMCVAVKELAKQNGWDESLKDVFVWVDFSCIPQSNPSTQKLAIRSLAAYASSATWFVIVAPDTEHADLKDTCDLGTYQRRMWCRAEQVCHSMRNGTEGMFLAVGKGSGDLKRVRNDFFLESLHVFHGDLTCCRLEHKGSSACDRQSLVVPLLGLYGELYRAAKEGIEGGNDEALHSVKTFLREIESHQEEIFPKTFQRVMWRKNKRVVEEVLLFGDLIERMKARIDGGGAYVTDTKYDGTESTKPSYVRHGATDFIRHGVTHGVSNIKVETAVGELNDFKDT